WTGRQRNLFLVVGLGGQQDGAAQSRNVWILERLTSSDAVPTGDTDGDHVVAAVGVGVIAHRLPAAAVADTEAIEAAPADDAGPQPVVDETPGCGKSIRAESIDVENGRPISSHAYPMSATVGALQPQPRPRQVRPHRGFSSCALDDSSPTTSAAVASQPTKSSSTATSATATNAAISAACSSSMPKPTGGRLLPATLSCVVGGGGDGGGGKSAARFVVGAPGRLLLSRRRKNGKFATQQQGSAAAAASSLSCRCPFTFVLPDLSRQPEGFRQFIEADLLDPNALASLEAAGCLNWWHRDGLASRLWPLATSGDGNCLLHAISLCMYGAHDRQLTLRAALHRYLRRRSAALYRRWRWQTHAELTRTTGLRLSDSEWRAEWKSLLQLARAAPKSTPTAPGDRHTYSSLEEIHVFVAANVIRRPIVVVADAYVKAADGGNLAPNPFAGLYLPLLERPETCCPYPVLLAFHSAHFSALLPMEASTASGDDYLPSAVPLVTPPPACASLPVHFAFDPGSGFKWSRASTVGDLAADGNDANRATTDSSTAALLAEYLHCCRLPLARPDCDSGGEDMPPAYATATFAGHGNGGDIGGVGGSSNRKHLTLAISNDLVYSISPTPLPISRSRQCPAPSVGKSDTLCRFVAVIRFTMRRRRRRPNAALIQQQQVESNRDSQQNLESERTSDEHESAAAPSAPFVSVLCARIGLAARPPKFTEVVTGYLVRAMATYQQQQKQQQQQSSDRQSSATEVPEQPATTGSSPASDQTQSSD
uniref:ubiquitinyl hydrolase 1 n=2 Tax=Macrostomum lignano TaxID=282301 RepID=A0A1I8FYB8_9PLAT